MLSLTLERYIALQATAIDITARVSLFSNPLNYTYFFWTHIWYVPVFLLILFCLLCVKITYLVRCITIFRLTGITLLLLVLLLDVFYQQHYNYFEMYWHDQNNTLLTNSVNRIHPLLLYLSATQLVLCGLCYNNQSFTTNQTHLFSYILYKFCNMYRTITLLLLPSLYLGSWWAAQEGSWGGWWNWDASEFFALLILFFLLLSFHKVAKTYTFIFYRYLVGTYALATVIFFILLQINFTSISHNFGFNSPTFANTTFLQGCTLLQLLLYKSSSQYIYTRSYTYFYSYTRLSCSLFYFIRASIAVLLIVNLFIIFLVPVLLEWGVSLSYLTPSFTQIILYNYILIIALLLRNIKMLVLLNTYFSVSIMELLVYYRARWSLPPYKILHLSLILSICVNTYFNALSTPLHELSSWASGSPLPYTGDFYLNCVMYTNITTCRSSSFDAKVLDLFYSNTLTKLAYHADLLIHKFVVLTYSSNDLAIATLALALYTSVLLIVLNAVII